MKLTLSLRPGRWFQMPLAKLKPSESSDSLARFGSEMSHPAPTTILFRVSFVSSECAAQMTQALTLVHRRRLMQVLSWKGE